MSIETLAYGLLVLGIAFSTGYAFGHTRGRLEEARDRLKKFSGEE